MIRMSRGRDCDIRKVSHPACNRLKSQREHLASRSQHRTAMTNETRLDTIANRQKRTRVRDVVFAIGIALAAVVSITSVQTACHAANAAPAHVAHR